MQSRRAWRWRFGLELGAAQSDQLFVRLRARSRLRGKLNQLCDWPLDWRSDLRGSTRSGRGGSGRGGSSRVWLKERCGRLVGTRRRGRTRWRRRRRRGRWVAAARCCRRRRRHGRIRADHRTRLRRGGCTSAVGLRVGFCGDAHQRRALRGGALIFGSRRRQRGRLSTFGRSRNALWLAARLGPFFRRRRHRARFGARPATASWRGRRRRSTDV